MKNTILKRLALRLTLVAALVLPGMADAQIYFTYTGNGDVNLGLRKTGTYQEKDEMVVYLGNIFTNFLELPIGTQINITNYTHQQLTNLCPDNLNNLRWSVFSSFQIGPLTNSLGIFPSPCCWYTVPRSPATVQTTPVARFSAGGEGALQQAILSVGANAQTISQELGTTNVYNNTLVVLESIATYPGSILSAFIGDPNDTTLADFGGKTFSWTVENTNNLTTATISDFYLNVPASTLTGPEKHTYIDPLTGLANGTADYLGYFTMNPNGTMTFTRANSTVVSPPSAGTVAGSVTNGFSPLKVIFTNSATSGTITNWVWNFGNGTIITNTTGSDVTNTYAAAGDYTVTLTVYGPGGSSAVTLANYIVSSPAAQITAALAAGKFVLSGTNCPAGVEYRILGATSLSPASWTPLATNYVLSNGTFAYTNSTANSAGFFRLVSP